MARTRVGHMIEHLICGTPLMVGQGSDPNHPQVYPQQIQSWLDVGSGNGEACTTNVINFMLYHGHNGQVKIACDPNAWESGDDWKIVREEYNDKCSLWQDKFDLVTALDVLEHLEKSEGEKMLDHFEEVANRLIIIFTPQGFLPQGNEQGFEGLNVHKSGWELEDFVKRGYVTYLTPKDFHHNPTGVEGDWSAILAWRNFAVRPKGT